jgi:hypothetical protein
MAGTSARVGALLAAARSGLCWLDRATGAVPQLGSAARPTIRHEQMASRSVQAMTGLRNRRRGALVIAAMISVAVAGVLLFVTTGLPAPPNVVVARPAAAEQSTNSVGGKGIPPSPGYTYSAPPDANPAPTANLKIVSSYLQVKYKSVTVVVTLPRGLGITNRVDVSVDFDERSTTHQRITQTYDNAHGNRIIASLAEGDGGKRQAHVVASLAEVGPNGNTVGVHAVRSTVDLQPLYDINLGHFHAYLYDDCDPIGDSEPHIYWRSPDGKPRNVEVSMSAGEDVPVSNLAATFTEVGQAANLKRPVFRVWEEDVEPGGFHGGLYSDGVTPLLPGSQTRTIDGVYTAENDNSCRVKLSYRITYTLRRYPNL